MATLGYQVYRFGRRFSRHPLVRRLIPERFRLRVQAHLMSGVMGLLPDRRYMEEVLLPAMVALQPSRLLDVGVEHYSSHYRDWFPADCEYSTLDFNPGVAQFGSPGKHIVGNALDLARYFVPNSLDIIVLNGAFGFGIDGPEEQERAIDAARTVLRPNGWLLIGWDSAIDGTPLAAPERSKKTALKDPLDLAAIAAGFVHTGPDGLPARTRFADSSHVYDWFRYIL